MKTPRPIFAAIAAAALACVTGAGCERDRHLVRELRPDATGPDSATKPTLPLREKEKHDEPETARILDVQSDAKKARPFFRSSRLSGALTDEGREIERDLGIR